MNRTASCACGRTSIQLSGDPEHVFVCYCDYCQRLTGSLMLAAAVFKEADVVETTGEPRVFSENPKFPNAEMYFCGTCSTAVHWVNPHIFPDLHLVALGCFADPEFRKPDIVYQTQYRHSWLGEIDCPHSFEAYPPAGDA